VMNDEQFIIHRFAFIVPLKALALRPRITPGVPLSVKRRVLITRDSVRSVTEDEALRSGYGVRRANDSTALQRLPSL